MGNARSLAPQLFQGFANAFLKVNRQAVDHCVLAAFAGHRNRTWCLLMPYHIRRIPIDPLKPLVPNAQSRMWFDGGVGRRGR
jgi:hypothetical protein